MHQFQIFVCNGRCVTVNADRMDLSDGCVLLRQDGATIAVFPLNQIVYVRLLESLSSADAEPTADSAIT